MMVGMVDEALVVADLLLSRLSATKSKAERINRRGKTKRKEKKRKVAEPKAFCYHESSSLSALSSVTLAATKHLDA